MAFLFWLIRYRVQRFVANIYLFIASWESVFHNVVRSAMLDRCQIGEKLIKISLQFTESTLSKWFGEKYICRLKKNCSTLQFYKSQHNLSWTFAVWENVFDMLQIIFLSPNAEKKTQHEHLHCSACNLFLMWIRENIFESLVRVS